MASIDKRPDGKYQAQRREYPGGPHTTEVFTPLSNAAITERPSARLEDMDRVQNARHER